MFVSIFIILIWLINKMFSLNSDALLVIVTFLLVFVTSLLVGATYLLYKTAKNQLAINLMAKFQDVWLSRETRLRREYLRDDEFKHIFNEAIKEAYGKPLDFKEEGSIRELLEPPKEIYCKKALKSFKNKLERAIYRDKATKKPRFTAYEALNDIIILWERLALIRNERYAIKLIKRYKNPINRLSYILQASMAVWIALSDPEEKQYCYYEDYILLLYNLELHNKFLYDAHKEGLNWTNRKIRKIEKEKKLYIKEA